MTLPFRCMFLAASIFTSSVAGQSLPPRLTVFPERPQAGNPIYLRYFVDNLCQGNTESERTTILQTESGGFRIEVPSKTVRYGCSDLAYARTFELGRFPAGRYEVEAEVVDKSGGAIPAIADGRSRVGVTVEVQPIDVERNDRGMADYSGLWWVPELSGSAVYIYQQPDRKLAVLIATYDDHDQPQWFFLGGGDWVDINTFRGPLLRSMGGPTLGEWYDYRGNPPLSLTTELLGDAELLFGFDPAFESSLNLTIRYLNGRVERSYLTWFNR